MRGCVNIMLLLLVEYSWSVLFCQPAPRLYICIIQQIYRQLGQETDGDDDNDAQGLRFLGPKALCLDCCVKIFFFMTVWQAKWGSGASNGMDPNTGHNWGDGTTVESRFG